MDLPRSPYPQCGDQYKRQGSVCYRLGIVDVHGGDRGVCCKRSGGFGGVHCRASADAYYHICAAGVYFHARLMSCGQRRVGQGTIKYIVGRTARSERVHNICKRTGGFGAVLAANDGCVLAYGKLCVMRGNAPAPRNYLYRYINGKIHIDLRSAAMAAAQI